MNNQSNQPYTTQSHQGEFKCSNCGATLVPSQAFCAMCGAPTSMTNSTFKSFNNNANPSNKKKIIIPVIIGIIAAILVVTLILIFRGSSIEEVVLSETLIELKADETAIASYTISPSDASDKSVEWQSSNVSVATVDSAEKITAVGEGSCTITITAGNKSDSLTVTVNAGPDLIAIYDSVGSPYYCDVASDGSYLSVDTNWLNTDDYFSTAAYDTLKEIITELGLPQSLLADMDETRAIDGRQTAEYDDISVSWSYHPDHGLEVIFKTK